MEDCQKIQKKAHWLRTGTELATIEDAMFYIVKPYCISC